MSGRTRKAFIGTQLCLYAYDVVGSNCTIALLNKVGFFDHCFATLYFGASIHMRTHQFTDGHAPFSSRSRERFASHNKRRTCNKAKKLLRPTDLGARAWQNKHAMHPSMHGFGENASGALKQVSSHSKIFRTLKASMCRFGIVQALVRVGVVSRART